MKMSFAAALKALALVAFLSFGASAQACSKCHAAADGGCLPGCTCCGTKPPTAASTKIDPSELPAPEPGVLDIAIKNFQYFPEDPVITPGTTVRWTNLDDAVHDSVSADFLWNSNYLIQNQSYEYTFGDGALGDYQYFCSIHGGMAASISVVAPEPAFATAIFALLGFRRKRAL